MCTDSDNGRELVRPLDKWLHSEMGQFHRGLSLTLSALAAFMLVVRRTQSGNELMVLGGNMVLVLFLAIRVMVRFRRPSAALRFDATAAPTYFGPSNGNAAGKRIGKRYLDDKSG